MTLAHSSPSLDNQVGDGSGDPPCCMPHSRQLTEESYSKKQKIVERNDGSCLCSDANLRPLQKFLCFLDLILQQKWGKLNCKNKVFLFVITFL